MDRKKSIALLNTLIEINNDRIEVYEIAANKTLEDDLKILFSQFVNTSRRCRHELMVGVQQLGGKATEGMQTSGQFFKS